MRPCAYLSSGEAQHTPRGLRCSTRVLEEPAQLVRVADHVNGADPAVLYVERKGAVAGQRMAHQQPWAAVDGDELEVGLRPVRLVGIAEDELRDAIRAQHRAHRRGRLAAAVRD